jgi:hypothetical protein
LHLWPQAIHPSCLPALPSRASPCCSRRPADPPGPASRERAMHRSAAAWEKGQGGQGARLSGKRSVGRAGITRQQTGMIPAGRG